MLNIPESARLIVVNGKGGVGKTTSSSSIAVHYALKFKREGLSKKVLLISTDPAHSTSDVFDQKFGGEATAVNGLPNLFVLEVSPSADLNKIAAKQTQNDPTLNMLGALTSGLFKGISAMPGIDEMFSFSKILKYLTSPEFDLIVFDTAPTGHTLKLFSLPTTAEAFLETLDNLKSSSLLSMAAMFGLPTDEINKSLDNITNSLRDVKQSSKNFSDPSFSTFIAVCIPEFLPLYETERLVQAFARKDIDVGNIIVNNILEDSCDNCKICNKIRSSQKKYLDQIDILYEDFDVTKVPVIADYEIRGWQSLAKFGNLLFPQQE